MSDRSSAPGGWTFDRFRSLLAEELGIPPERISPESTFEGDLGIDSLRLVGMLSMLDRFDLDVPIELAWDLRTVGDAYALVRERTTNPAND